MADKCFCQEEKEGEELCTVNCGGNHKFHKQCIQKWCIEPQNPVCTCPLCRGEITAISCDGVKYNFRLITKLIQAIRIRNIDKLRALLNKFMKGEIEDYFDDTPLWWAVYYNFLDGVNALLDTDTNTDFEYNGKSPLMLALEKGNLEIVRALLETSDADVNFKTRKNETALIFAANKKESSDFWDDEERDIDDDVLKVVKMIVRRGADINAADDQGNTALIKAVLKGNHKIVRFLVRKGADVNVANNKGGTALTLSSSRSMRRVIEDAVSWRDNARSSERDAQERSWEKEELDGGASTFYGIKFL